MASYPGCCRHLRAKEKLQKMAARSTYKQPLKDYILEFTQVGEVGCPCASTCPARASEMKHEQFLIVMQQCDLSIGEHSSDSFRIGPCVADQRVQFGAWAVCSMSHVACSWFLEIDLCLTSSCSSSGVRDPITGSVLAHLASQCALFLIPVPGFLEMAVTRGHVRQCGRIEGPSTAFCKNQCEGET